ncbi:MAG: 2-dehydro-3-deoxygalactonokinase [Proteobacteria bacterium]|nr:2-dehydro-3-deoxygalactonokinase [Pseudomonadota bacterium]
MAKMSMLIGGDWGGSNLRLFRYDENGVVLETRERTAGVLAVADGTFEATLTAHLGDWLDAAPVRIVLSGMIGSRQGWQEASYAPCPADAEAIAALAQRVASPLGDVRILPGAQVTRVDGCIDVMRGEETQVFGVQSMGARAGDTATRLVVMPGTHSKWVRIEGGRIVDFTTYMTGELYAVLKTHSILGRLMDGDAADAHAFATGVQRTLADPALSKWLFSARSEGLFGRIAPVALASYLSGLLIGAEVGAAMRETDVRSATIVATPELARNYRIALQLAGFDTIEVVDGAQASAAGLWRLANALPLDSGVRE